MELNSRQNQSPWIRQLRDIVGPSIPRETSDNPEHLRPNFYTSLPPLTPRAQHLLGLAETLHQELALVMRTPVRTFAVGGVMRDIFRQAHPRDLDLEVVAPWRPLVNALPNCELVAHSVARPEYRSITCTLTNGETIDIACPSATIEGSLNEHVHQVAMRRGFTLNSIYFDLDSHTAIDPFNGIDDIKAGVLAHIPGTEVAEDPRLFFSGIAGLLRFGFTPAEATREQFSQVGPLLDLRWAGGRVPQKIPRLVDKMIERGVDLPSLCDKLLSFGYLKSSFGSKLDQAHTLIRAMADTKPLPLAYDFAHRRWLPTIAEILVTRTPPETTTDLRTTVALGMLVGLGFAPSSLTVKQVQPVVQQQELLRKLTVDGQSSTLVSVFPSTAETNDHAREVLRNAHPTSRLFTARSFGEQLCDMFRSPSAQHRAFICSRKLLNCVDEGNGRPFLVVCGPEALFQIRALASNLSMEIHRRSDISCQLGDRNGGRLDVVHLRALPTARDEKLCFIVHNREARDRIASAGGALYNLETKQLFQA